MDHLDLGFILNIESRMYRRPRMVGKRAANSLPVMDFVKSRMMKTMSRAIPRMEVRQLRRIRVFMVVGCWMFDV